MLCYILKDRSNCHFIIFLLSLDPEGGRVEGSRRFFSIYLCRDLVIIDFFGNLRCAIKLVLNFRQRILVQWSALVCCTYDTKVNSEKKKFLMVHR